MVKIVNFYVGVSSALGFCVVDWPGLLLAGPSTCFLRLDYHPPELTSDLRIFWEIKNLLSLHFRCQPTCACLSVNHLLVTVNNTLCKISAWFVMHTTRNVSAPAGLSVVVLSGYLSNFLSHKCTNYKLQCHHHHLMRYGRHKNTTSRQNFDSHFIHSQLLFLLHRAVFKDNLGWHLSFRDKHRPPFVYVSETSHISSDHSHVLTQSYNTLMLIVSRTIFAVLVPPHIHHHYDRQWCVLVAHKQFRSWSGSPCVCVVCLRGCNGWQAIPNRKCTTTTTGEEKSSLHFAFIHSFGHWTNKDAGSSVVIMKLPWSEGGGTGGEQGCIPLY